jgi:hypothetical protein
MCVCVCLGIIIFPWLHYFLSLYISLSLSFVPIYLLDCFFFFVCGLVVMVGSIVEELTFVECIDIGAYIIHVHDKVHSSI